MIWGKQFLLAPPRPRSSRAVANVPPMSFHCKMHSFPMFSFVAENLPLVKFRRRRRKMLSRPIILERFHKIKEWELRKAAHFLSDKIETFYRARRSDLKTFDSWNENVICQRMKVYFYFNAIASKQDAGIIFTHTDRICIIRCQHYADYI